MSRKKMVSISQTELKKLKKKIEAQEKKKQKLLERKKDGMSPYLEGKIRSALREIWQRSRARKICLDRVSEEGGYFRCEAPCCKGKLYPKVYVDHMTPVGIVDGGFIKRMFVPSGGLKALCKSCHDKKTKEDNVKTKKLRI